MHSSRLFLAHLFAHSAPMRGDAVLISKGQNTLPSSDAPVIYESKYRRGHFLGREGYSEKQYKRNRKRAKAARKARRKNRK